MTLSDVLSRSVSMEWHEAVALVRGVVERLLETSGQANVVPELHQIEISPGGQIGVTGGVIAAEPVRRLGQLLQAMLGYTGSPVQLRLVVVQATAPAPAFGSIREYDEALAYFERPDRSAVLQALYARAVAAPSRSDSSQVSTLDSIAPLPMPGRPENSGKEAAAKPKPRHLRLVVGGALLLLVCAGAAMVPGVSAVTERSGLGRLSSADAADVKPSGEVFHLDSSPRAKSATAVANDRPVLAVDVLPELTEVVPQVTEVVPQVTEVVPEVTGDEEMQIYSADSKAVSPPLSVRPQLPSGLPSNVSAQHLSRIDLIVSRDGAVESVKLVGTPRNVHDSMLLSAVKSWQFQPALKDGRPVRYRKTVWVALQ